MIERSDRLIDRNNDRSKQQRQQQRIDKEGDRLIEGDQSVDRRRSVKREIQSIPSIDKEKRNVRVIDRLIDKDNIN
jgi:hypothetical protein